MVELDFSPGQCHATVHAKEVGGGCRQVGCGAGGMWDYVNYFSLATGHRLLDLNTSHLV